MTYVLALLWVCALAMVVLVPVLVHLLTTPVCEDLAVLERHRDARTALGRMNTRHSISVPTSRRSYGPTPHGVGTEPFAASAMHGRADRACAASACRFHAHPALGARTPGGPARHLTRHRLDRAWPRRHPEHRRLAGGESSVPMASSRIFDLAARACGHDPTTVTGAEDARHDHRVHDLAERYQAEVNDAAHDALDGLVEA